VTGPNELPVAIRARPSVQAIRSAGVASAIEAGLDNGKMIGLRLPAEGRVVINAVTLDTLTAATEYFDNAGYQVEVTTVNIARTRPLTDYKMFEAYNPVYIIAAVKE
jgi:precorrin-6Y C5,15-methyltransferase (decarboxylating)